MRETAGPQRPELRQAGDATDAFPVVLVDDSEALAVWLTTMLPACGVDPVDVVTADDPALLLAAYSPGAVVCLGEVGGQVPLHLMPALFEHDPQARVVAYLRDAGPGPLRRSRAAGAVEACARTGHLNPLLAVLRRAAAA